MNMNLSYHDVETFHIGETSLTLDLSQIVAIETNSAGCLWITFKDSLQFVELEDVDVSDDDVLREIRFLTKAWQHWKASKQ